MPVQHSRRIAAFVFACIAAMPAGAQSNAPVGQAPDDKRPPEIPALVDMRGVLTPRGKLIVEPSLQYAHSTNNRVALVGFSIIPALTIGLIDVRSVSRDTFIGTLSGRYGVTERFEVEGRLPYVYRHDSTLSRPLATPSTADSLFESSGHGLGDVELAARYQLNDGGPNTPYYVAGLRFKSRTGKDPFQIPVDPATNLSTRLPTGSGFLGLQPSVTAILPSDPAVFFGSVSYLWNIKRDVGGSFGTVDPGDALGFTFGTGLALNDKSSLSIGYDHSTVFRTKQNGVPVANTGTSQLGTLLIGASYRVAPGQTLILTLGVGVTREAPDVQIVLRYPVLF